MFILQTYASLEYKLYHTYNLEADLILNSYRKFDFDVLVVEVKKIKLVS